MDFTRLKDYMDKMVSEYKVPGVDCVVYREHEMLFRYYTGVKDKENNIPMQGDELYLIFSMTKMLTVTCALQLLEQGKYLLTDHLSMYMPEFEKMLVTRDELNTENAAKITTGALIGENVNLKADFYAKNPITIKDLFVMGAGLDYNLEAPGIKKAVSEGRTSTREVVGALSETVLGFEPGTRFRYSLCHDVLGALIEIWSGMKFGEYMKKNLLDPLEMKDTFFDVPKDKVRQDRMAARYIAGDNGELERVPLECKFNITNEYESGGAGLASSASDYAVFLDALANGGVGKNGNRILSEASVKMMGMNQIKGQAYDDFDELRPGYGYGLGVRTHMDKTRSGSLSPIGEFGWDGSAGGFSMVDPVNKLSLTYFQHSHKWFLRCQSEIRNILYTCLD